MIHWSDAALWVCATAYVAFIIGSWWSGRARDRFWVEASNDTYACYHGGVFYYVVQASNDEAMRKLALSLEHYLPITELAARAGPVGVDANGAPCEARAAAHAYGGRT